MLAHSHHMQLADAGTKQHCFSNERCESGGRQHTGQSDKARTARPVAGASRKGNNPVLFLVGNSTMRTGTLGNGNNGQWGWGYYAGDYFDSNRITVENHALGGTSSRTFYNRLWPDVIKRRASRRLGNHRTGTQ